MFANVTRGFAILSLTTALAACNAGNPGAGLDVGAGNTTQPAQPAAAPVVQGICPPIALRDGTAFFRTYAKGGKGVDGAPDDPEKVIHQASLADTTRACVRTETNQLNITVMVQGRLVAGPLGKAGPVSMPIRVAVIDGDQVLYSELTKFESTLADPNQASQFVFTKEVTGLPGEISRLAKVYVGFDEGPQKKK